MMHGSNVMMHDHNSAREISGDFKALTWVKRGVNLAAYGRMNRSALLASVALVLTACGLSEGELVEGDELGEAASTLTVTAEAATEMLNFVNYPGTTAAVLDQQLGLDARAAANIINRRNGVDGRFPSPDDRPFISVPELDAVPYVGDAALLKLASWSHAHPAPKSEQAEGVTFAGWEVEAVVWAANVAAIGTFNGLLDNRAAANLVAARPFANVTQIGNVALIGPNALRALKGQARTWWFARQNQPSQPSLAGTFDGVVFDEATATRALELTNTAAAGELSSKGLASSAVSAIVAGRPFASLSAVAAASGVGPASMQALKNWASAPVNPPARTLAEVRAALETAAGGIWFPSETDAIIVYLQGTQLNGAPITEAVIRAQLTVQHDAQIANVMYTDPSQRSLAAKTEVEERDALAYLQRIIDNTDPADEVSLENAAKIGALKGALEANLTDLKMVRFGTVSISTFIVGRAPTGELVALLTGQVET
jgi:DNA uptake protein ComE-like DNA-binding protein